MQPVHSTSRRLKSGLLTAGVCAATLIAATGLNAASMTFQAPTTSFSDTSVLDQPLSLPGYTNVVIAQAQNFGGGAQSVTTIGLQTINFADAPESFGAPSGTVSGLFYGGAESNAALFTGSTGSAGFDAVLQSQAWASSLPTWAGQNKEVVRIGSLTIGQTYIVQLFASDMRGGSAARTQSFADATSGGNASSVFSTATATSVVATFTADAVTQDIFIVPGAGNPDDTTFAAFTLYSATASAIPEPSTYAASVGVLALGAVITRRRRSTSPSA